MTDQLRQAAQQALEALVQLDGLDTETECVTIDLGDVITALKSALEQQAEPPPEWPLIKNILAVFGLDAIAFVAEFKAAQQQAEPVAWDVFELRLYGAPQEKQHRVLWVDRYTQPDGSTPDLDGLLEAAKTEGGIDGGAKTLHVRPLYAAPPQRPWVGLEIEEVQDSYNSDYQAQTRAVEKLLKERNHD